MTEHTDIASETWERLSALLEGDLSESEASDLRAELDRDPSLQAVYQDLERATRLVRTVGPVAAPAGFEQRVLDAVASEPIPANTPLGSGLRRFPFGSVLVALAAAVVLWLAVPREDEDAEDAAAAARIDLQKVVDAVPAPAPAPLPAAVPAGEQKLGPRRVAGTKGGEEALSTSGSPPAPPEIGGTSEGPLTVPAPDNAEPAPVGFAAPLRYSVSTRDPGAVSRLVQLAGRFGGRVLDDRGTALSSADLSRGPATVVLQLPADRLSEFDAEIRRLGPDVSTARDEETLHGDTVEVQVDVELAQ